MLKNSKLWCDGNIFFSYVSITVSECSDSKAFPFDAMPFRRNAQASLSAGKACSVPRAQWGDSIQQYEGV